MPIEDMLITWPLCFLTIPGSTRQGEPQRAEIVDLHGALEIVQPIERVFDAAPDRAARIVDQDVDAAVLALDPLDQRVALGRVGDVGGIGDERQPAAGGFLSRGFELLRIARRDDDDAAGRGKPERGRQADARRAAGDEHDAAGDAAAQRAVDEEIGIEVALPVVPQAPGIVLERRHDDARPA